MCGIVGHVGDEEAAPILLDGLRRLEYRGYDSAGLAVQTNHGIEIVRAVGKLRNLEKALSQKGLPGKVGIGHTRWATHGRPSEVNAHPHVAGPVRGRAQRHHRKPLGAAQRARGEWLRHHQRHRYRDHRPSDSPRNAGGPRHGHGNSPRPRARGRRLRDRGPLRARAGPYRGGKELIPSRDRRVQGRNVLRKRHTSAPSLHQRDGIPRRRRDRRARGRKASRFRSSTALL